MVHLELFCNLRVYQHYPTLAQGTYANTVLSIWLQCHLGGVFVTIHRRGAMQCPVGDIVILAVFLAMDLTSSSVLLSVDQVNSRFCTHIWSNLNILQKSLIKVFILTFQMYKLVIPNFPDLLSQLCFITNQILPFSKEVYCECE